MADPTFTPTITDFTLEPTELKGHAYMDPRKLILTKENLQAFQASKAHETIVSYITTLNESIVGVKLTDDISLSPVRKSALSAPRYCFKLTKAVPGSQMSCLDGDTGLERTRSIKRA